MLTRELGRLIQQLTLVVTVVAVLSMGGIHHSSLIIRWPINNHRLVPRLSFVEEESDLAGVDC